MKVQLLSLAAIFAVGCATTGPMAELSGTGVGSVSLGVECVTEELREDGWTVGPVSDAGLVRAESGANWVEATILPATELNSAYLLQVRTSNTDMAGDAAADLITNCTT